MITSTLKLMHFVIIITYAIAWLDVAAILHYMSGDSKTDGTFGGALGVAGWAYAPTLVLLVPRTVYAWNKIKIRYRSMDQIHSTSLLR